MNERKKIGVISLGCDKNRIDTEKMLGILSDGYEIVSDIDKANIVIINTCAFIKISKEESIEEILSASELKKSGSVEKIIVTGCLPQKYSEEIFNELPEVDAFLGVSDYKKLPEVIDSIYGGKRVKAVGNPCLETERLIKRVKTTSNFAYLKIADGCSNHCTYCSIPSIRGKYRSVPLENLISEAKELGNLNELILVAQDVTAYGQDLVPARSITDLIRALSALQNVKGIRLLYCYPERITDELIRELASNAKLIRYIDIPLQHADDRILKLMNRKGTAESYLSLIERLKRSVPGIAIRSTFITGFPTEDEEAVDNLVAFLKRAKLFNVGFFKYSREEGTPAYNMSGQIPAGEKTKRYKKLYSVQKAIVKENLKALCGRIFKVAAEGFDENLLVYYGRAYFNAPDVDGKIYFFSKEEVKIGEYYNVKIHKASGYDLYGEIYEPSK